MKMTCDAAFEKYKAENSDNAVGRSLFFTLRPPNVLVAAKTPHNVCSCRYHQDFSLIFDSLKRFLFDKSINSTKKLTAALVCSTHGYNCMASICKKCSNFSKKLTDLVDESDLPHYVKFFQWDTKELPKRIEVSCTLKELLKEIEMKFEAYKLHSYIANAQSLKCKLQLPQDLTVRENIMFLLTKIKRRRSKH